MHSMCMNFVRCCMWVVTLDPILWWFCGTNDRYGTRVQEREKKLAAETEARETAEHALRQERELTKRLQGVDCIDVVLCTYMCCVCFTEPKHHRVVTHLSVCFCL